MAKYYTEITVSIRVEANTDLEAQRMIEECYTQLCAHTLANVDSQNVTVGGLPIFATNGQTYFRQP
jgi:hypothetical protein